MICGVVPFRSDDGPAATLQKSTIVTGTAGKVRKLQLFVSQQISVDVWYTSIQSFPVSGTRSGKIAFRNKILDLVSCNSPTASQTFASGLRLLLLKPRT